MFFVLFFFNKDIDRNLCGFFSIHSFNEVEVAAVIFVWTDIGQKSQGTYIYMWRGTIAKSEN